ncbi:MAG: DegT/DnrJ/EryC1/StrS family aminotransferase [Lachnospiraceae bacterium]|nr:DegT/DnrJ/EryC1/StrS family aminotransferase [Lachnospiraceae bacterium]
MHGPELEYIEEAYRTNWMSTVGENINIIEKMVCEKIGCGYAVALSSGTAALHLAIKLAGERLYGRPSPGHGTLEGKKVFATDMTFAATVNPIAYEGGEAVFIDAEYDTWNMDPLALEKAFEIYPEVRLVVLAHLYGTPAKIDEIRKICDAHNALLVEDAAESFGASFEDKQTGAFGDYSIISFNGNKIITGSTGGMLLCDSKEEADKARKWSTQSREEAPWYQHEELGYNYRMSNVVAGVVRGQLEYLETHIEQKKVIYHRYEEGLAGLPVKMNPFDKINSTPNYWLSCLLIDKESMCRQVRTGTNVTYMDEHNKSCPTEILKAIAFINAEGRPIWKPMHMQPVFRKNSLVTFNGIIDKATDELELLSVSSDIFARGLCLPSDNKMTENQQRKIIEIITECFN